MKKIYLALIVLFVSLVVVAQTNIDLTTIDTAYTTTFESELVLDVAKCASAVASPNVSFDNPFKDQAVTSAQISFDVYNYYGTDSIKHLGALISIFDPDSGRLYFSNNCYLGYNGIGGWYDANLNASWAPGTDFLGGNTWKNVKLQFTSTSYAMYIDDAFTYNQLSTDITVGGDLTDHSRVLDFFDCAASFVIGTGSWWSDNTRPNGTYYDAQFSYLKNITLTPNFSTGISIGESLSENNGEVISEEFYSINGAKIGNDYNELVPGLYIKSVVYSNGAVKKTKIVKVQNNYRGY